MLGWSKVAVSEDLAAKPTGEQLNNVEQDAYVLSHLGHVFCLCGTHWFGPGECMRCMMPRLCQLSHGGSFLQCSNRP